MRKRHLFLGVLIAMCLICVSGLCACANRGGGGGVGTLVDFEATKTETAMYKEMYTCKDKVYDDKGNVYPVDYEVTDSQGNKVKTRQGAFPVLDITYTVKYTAHVADDNMPTSTVTLKTDTLEPTVLMSEIEDGFINLETTLPVATYSDDWNFGGITDYTLYYLGTAGNEVQEECAFNPADPNAEIKNGGTFMPTEIGNYKVVVTASDKSDEVSVEHSVVTERTFAVADNPIGEYTVESGKLVDFGQEVIQYFLKKSGATVSLVDSTTAQAGGKAIGVPFDDKQDDKMVLKVVSNSSATWQERGGVHGAIVQRALAEVGKGNIANKTVRFKYYVDDATTSADVRVNLRWVLSGEKTTSVECKLRPGAWTEFSFVIRDFDPIIGTGTNLDGNTADDLADLTDHISFFTYTATPASALTFYVSDIYIEDTTFDLDATSLKTKPYDFDATGIEDFVTGDDYTATSIVAANTIEGASEVSGAPTGEEKVLKVDWTKNKEDGSRAYKVLSSEPLRRALHQLSDNEIKTGILSYWIYNDSETAYDSRLSFMNGERTVRFNNSAIAAKTWTKVLFPLGQLTDLAAGATPNNLDSKLDYVALYLDNTKPADATTSTLYLSDISIESGYQLGKKDGTLVNFGAEGAIGIMRHGALIANTEIVEVGPGKEVTSLPFAEKSGDNKVLKVNFVDSTAAPKWIESGNLIEPLVFQQALKQYSAEELEKATISFKVYYVKNSSTSNGAITMHFSPISNFNTDPTAKFQDGTVTVKRNLHDWISRGNDMTFIKNPQSMDENVWSSYSVNVKGDMSPWTTGKANTPILGGGAFGECTAETLADNFGSFGFYFNSAPPAGDNGVTLYISNFYIDVDEDREVADPVVVKLVDFMSLSTDKLMHSSDVTSAEIVTIGDADTTGSVPYANQAGDTKALKLTFARTSGSWIDTNALIASDVFQNALRAVDPSNIEKATLKFKIYCKGAKGGGMTINICNKDRMTWANNATDTGRAENVRFALKTSTMTGNAWTEYAIPITGSGTWSNGVATTTILGGEKGKWASDNDTKNKYNNSFGGLTASELADNFGSIALYYDNTKNGSTGNTLYVSNIYLEYLE